MAMLASNVDLLRNWLRRELPRVPGTREGRRGIVFINLGSLLAQIVQIAGYPTLLALALSGVDYPSWVIGIVVSFQWIVVLGLAPLAPAVLAKIGARRSCQAGVVVSVLALLLLLASSAIAAIAISSLLMGVGLTIRWVACDTWIVESVPEKLRGRAVGVHETLMGLGIAIGPILTMLSNGNETAAIVGFILILILSFLSFSFENPLKIQENVTSDSKDRKFILVFRLLFLVLLAAMVAGYIETAMVALLPIYLMNFSYSEAQALILLSVFGLGGTILQVPLGWIADRWSFRVGQVLCVSLIIVGSVLLIAAMDRPSVIVVALFFWGGCVGGLNTLAVIEAGSTLKTGLSGTGMAFIASSYTFGGAMGPIVSGSALNLVHGHGAIVVILGLMIVYALTLALSTDHSRLKR